MVRAVLGGFLVAAVPTLAVFGFFLDMDADMPGIAWPTPWSGLLHIHHFISGAGLVWAQFSPTPWSGLLFFGWLMGDEPGWLGFGVGACGGLLIGGVLRQSTA